MAQPDPRKPSDSSDMAAAERRPENALHTEEDEENDEPQFLEESDVLAELPDDGDHPMDEDDDGEVAGNEEVLDGVVWDDSSIQHFPTHAKSVFAIDFHPTQPFAVSGGEDDLGYVWNVDNGEQIVKLTGHTDSVTSATFSKDGELVATGGMDGKVRIWRHVGKQSWRVWEFLTELRIDDEIMWLRWHPKGTVLLAGSNDSTIWMWQLPSGLTMQVFAGHTSAVQCGSFTTDGKRIVTSDEEGHLIVWDPRSAEPTFKLLPSDARFGLEGGITALGVNPTSALAVAGGASGGVRVVNVNNGTIVGALQGHAEGESVESIAFVDLGLGGQGAVVTGGTDGRAFVWDLNTMRLRTTLSHDDAITTMVTHPAPNAHMLTTASVDRTLRTWDVRTGTLVKEHKGHQGPVLGVAVGQAAAGDIAVTAGDDGVCLVFSLNSE